MDIGKLIKQLRREKGMSQKDLAAKAHLAQSAISYIESGSKHPNIDTIRRLADALEISMSSLFPDWQLHPINWTEPHPTLPSPQSSVAGWLCCSEPPSHSAAPPSPPQGPDLLQVLTQESVYLNGELLSEQDKKDISQILKIFSRQRLLSTFRSDQT